MYEHGVPHLRDTVPRHGLIILLLIITGVYGEFVDGSTIYKTVIHNKLLYSALEIVGSPVFSVVQGITRHAH